MFALRADAESLFVPQLFQRGFQRVAEERDFGVDDKIDEETADRRSDGELLLLDVVHFLHGVVPEVLPVPEGPDRGHARGAVAEEGVVVVHGLPAVPRDDLGHVLPGVRQVGDQRDQRVAEEGQGGRGAVEFDVPFLAQIHGVAVDGADDFIAHVAVAAPGRRVGGEAVKLQTEDHPQGEFGRPLRHDVFCDLHGAGDAAGVVVGERFVQMGEDPELLFPPARDHGGHDVDGAFEAPGVALHIGRHGTAGKRQTEFCADGGRDGKGEEITVLRAHVPAALFGEVVGPLDAVGSVVRVGRVVVDDARRAEVEDMGEEARRRSGLGLDHDKGIVRIGAAQKRFLGDDAHPDGLPLRRGGGAFDDVEGVLFVVGDDGPGREPRGRGNDDAPRSDVPADGHAFVLVRVLACGGEGDLLRIGDPQFPEHLEGSLRRGVVAGEGLAPLQTEQILRVPHHAVGVDAGKNLFVERVEVRVHDFTGLSLYWRRGAKRSLRWRRL